MGTAEVVLAVWPGHVHVVYPGCESSIGGVDYDMPASSRDAGCATADWPEHRYPGNPNLQLVGPSASGACVPAGIQR